MKLLIGFFLFLNFLSVNLNEIRSKYETASISEKNLNDFTHTLSKAELTNSLMIAYTGASKVISAKFYFNPITKLAVFNEGKNKIEAAVQSDPKNIEIRYIRYSVQINVPSILAYNSKINEDKKILQSYVNDFENQKKDSDLYSRIKSYLKLNS